MIFKTFQTDLDGISNKIGFSKRSFAEWGKQVSNSFKESEGIINSFKNTLKTAFTVPVEKDNSWIKNKLGEIVDKDNINSYIPELTGKKASDLAQRIREQSVAVADATDGWEDYFAELKNSGQGYIVDLIKNTDDLSKLTGEDLVKANQQARASALAHNEAIKAQTFSAKAGKVALQALAMAGNMIAMWAISEVISGLVKLTQMSKDVADSAKELGDSFNNTKSEISDYKSKIEELYSTINDSNSSIEDVTDARQTLMSVQDELIDKFGTEKETIELITAAINNQSEALDTLTEKQWQVTKNDFNDGGFWNDIGNWAKGYEDNIDRMVSKMENTREILSFSYNDLDSTDFTELKQLLKDRGWDYQSTLGGFVKEGNLREIYSEILEIQNLANDIETPDYFLKDLTKDANSAKETIESYGDMWDTYILQDKIFANEDLADSWHDVTEAYSEYEKAFTSGDEDAIEESIGNFSELMKSILDDSDIEGSVKDYFLNMYPVLKNEVEKWEFHTKILPEYDTHSLNGKTKADVLETLQTDGIQDGEQTFNSILNLASKFGLITGDNTEKIQQLLDLLVEWGILQDSINDSVSDYGLATEISITPTLSSSVEQIARQLEPQFTKLGDAYKEIFKIDEKTGKSLFSLDDVDNSMLEDLRTTFAEIEEEVGVAFDASVLNPFFDTLTNKSSTVEQVQDAFNNLATAYFYSTETLEHLTSETADAIEKQLEEMGVQNAAEVVAEALTAKTEELIVAKEYLAQTGKELATATEEEQTAFILEQIEAGNCGEALALLQLKKLLVNSAQINTSADIQQIMNLASAAGMGAEVLTQLANAKSILGTVEAGGNVSLASYEKALSDVESAKQTMLDWKPVELDFSNVGGGASKAGGAGKDAGDAYVDAFEEELKDLQRLRDSGVIDEKEYLDRLRALYQKYFKDKKKYAEQYAKYERQYLEGMKSLYDSALSGISKLMSSQIDGYNDAKEAAVSSLTEEKEARLAVIDAQKEQLEAEQDLIDEQIKEKQKIIDGIQKEIDAMKEAREERQRQLDLQKAQYELERMMHQRTILQYSEDKGMHYINDSSGARSAKEKVDDAKFEIEIAKKEIKLIEEEIDLLEEQKDAIQDQIDALDKQADSIEKYYSKMISEQEKYFDSLISNMEKQKSKWEELAEIEEIAKAYSAIEQVFGDMGYTVQDILNGNEQAFEDFKSKYISLMNDMNSNASFAEGLSYATGVAEENLGSFLDKTKETADGISDLSAKGSELNTVAEGMGGLAESATTANANTGELAASMGELGTNTEGISDNLTNINDALNGLPETDKLADLAATFTSLGEAIQAVADVLGIGEEGAVSTLVSALNEISTLSLDGGGDGGEEGAGGGIISQFNNLKTAVDDVTNAISGGGSSGSTGGGDASNSSSPSMSAGAGDGEGASGLISAIGEIKPATDEALGGGGEEGESEGEGSGAIPQFQELKTAVDDVTAAIGTADSEGGEGTGEGAESTTLIGALRAQYETASETIPETKALFEELLESIMSCVSALNTMVSLMGSMADASGGLGGSAVNIKPNAKGTAGNAFAGGTGSYKGLANREKNALVSEYGQTEMTVLPNGKTIITDKPTMMDLPKDTVIFNEEQTKKIMDSKVDASGNAYASGTDNGSVPYQPTGELAALMDFCKQNVKSILKSEQEIALTVHEMQKQINNGIMSGINSVTNTAINNISNNNKPGVVIGDINVTCPGVTSQQVAEQLGGVLGKELDKQFNGFNNYVDQQSRIR